MDTHSSILCFDLRTGSPSGDIKDMQAVYIFYDFCTSVIYPEVFFIFNEKVFCLFRIENSERLPIDEFCALEAKIYAYSTKI